jgi:hypothetical protein
MGDLNVFKALRIIALRDVLDEPPEYHIRYVFRWFSRNFHVPLPQVAEIPLDEVLQAFYESRYEDMSDEEREAERLILIETEAGREKRMREADADKLNEFEFKKMANEIAAEQAKKEKAKANEPISEHSSPFMSSLPEPSLDPPITLDKPPPNIKMNFLSKEEFEKRLEEEGIDLDDAPDGNLPLKNPSTPDVMK